MNLDFLIFHFLNQFAKKSSFLDFVIVFFARYFEYFLLFVLFLFLIKNFKKYYLMVSNAFLAAFFSRFVIAEILHWLYFRPRPFVENQVNLLFDYDPTKPSFPSGHAVFYFAIATVVFLYFKKNYPQRKFCWGISLGFFLASFLIALARVFSGIHWPSDILVGAIIGVLSGYAVYRLFTWPYLHNLT